MSPKNDTDSLIHYLARYDIPCPKCTYNLRGITQNLCPECGGDLRLTVVGNEYLSERQFIIIIGAYLLAANAPQCIWWLVYAARHQTFGIAWWWQTAWTARFGVLTVAGLFLVIAAGKHKSLTSSRPPRSIWIGGWIVVTIEVGWFLFQNLQQGTLLP